MKKLFKQVPEQWVRLFRNKYFLASFSFLLWLTFFDRNDFISQLQYQRKLNNLQQEQQYYLDEIAKNRQAMVDLLGNPKNLEKYAREQYRMKKDNEEIFVVLSKPAVKK